MKRSWMDRIENRLARLPYFRSHPRILRLSLFVFSAFAIYMLFKAPAIFLLTEYIGVHYVWSGFIAGMIITLINFLPSEFLIWRGKDETKRQ